MQLEAKKIEAAQPTTWSSKVPEVALNMIDQGINMAFPWILLRLDFGALLKIKWMKMLVKQLRDYNKTGKTPAGGQWGGI